MEKFNKINYLKFEYYCIEKHIETFNQETYHWEEETYEKYLIGKWYYSQIIKIKTNMSQYLDIYNKLILNTYVKKTYKRCY